VNPLRIRSSRVCLSAQVPSGRSKSKLTAPKMEKRIELERRGKEPREIQELNLDNTRATQIEGLTDEYTALESLSLIKIGLTSLKGFPKLPNLQRLELGDNRISHGLNVLKDCPKLSHLNLSNNKIKDLEALEPLKSFDKLTHLDLFNNDICNTEDYRSKVFKMLPNLKYLDDADADLNEAEDSDEDEEDDDDDDDDDDEEEDEEDAADPQNGATAADSDEDDDDAADNAGEEDEEDESDEEDEGPGLAAIYNENLDDDEDGDDFDEEDAGEEDDDDEIDEEEESEEPRGKRRKFDESNGDEGGTAD